MAHDSLMSRIHSVFTAHTDRVKAGQSTPVEEMLADLHNPTRVLVLLELVRIDLLQSTAEEQSANDCGEYLRRFPELQFATEELLGDSTALHRQVVAALVAMAADVVAESQVARVFDEWTADTSTDLVGLLVEQEALPRADADQLRQLVVGYKDVRNGSDASHHSLRLLEEVTARFAQSAVTTGHEVAEQQAGNGDERNIDATVSVVAQPANLGGERLTGIDSDGCRFRVLRPHATGGLGEVSVATDMELKREVALKEIRSRYAGDEHSRARFLLEAEVTGGLEHPGIVPVYGLGRFSDGRPYYAMRFIRGDSLKAAADRFHEQGDQFNFASVESRKLLGRFIDVCNAVAYAHSRGVLHRDLKPGNVMLGKYGETLVVDWGLAKVGNEETPSAAGNELPLQVSSGSEVAATQVGSVIGTPGFMPPEQASGDMDQLGPASDVYSLGATFYYLLTGTVPIVGDSLQDVLNKVRSGDFRNPRSIQSALPPSLVSICLKAMELHPEDRYQSPRELADDVERFLADEAVKAHQDPFVVRARRWARKHPRTVSTVSASILVGLVSAVTLAGVIAVKNDELETANSDLRVSRTQLAAANDELRGTNKRLREANAAEKRAKQVAEAARQESDAVLVFFEEKVLAAARPQGLDGGLGIAATIRAAVDEAESEIAQAFQAQPLVEARIRHTLGRTYDYLGEPKLAVNQHARTLELFEKELGADSAITIAALNDLALAKSADGDFEASRQDLEMAFNRATEKFGPNHKLTLETKGNLGGVYGSLTQFDRAIETMLEVYVAARKKKPADRPNLVSLLNSLGTTYVEAQKLDKAIVALRAAVDRSRREHGANSPLTWTSENNLAGAYVRRGDHKLAIPLLDRLLELRRERLGDDNPQTVSTMSNLAAAYVEIGRYDDAIKLYTDALQIALAKRTEKHPDTLSVMDNLGDACRRAARFGEAIKWHKRALEGRQDVLPKNHRDILLSMNNLGTAYKEFSKYDKAEPLLRDVIPLMKEKLGEKNLDVLTAINNLGLIYLGTQRFREAISMLRQNHELLQKHYPAEEEKIFTAASNLADAYWQANRHAESLKLREEMLTQRSQKKPNDLLTLNATTGLGLSYYSVGRGGDAIRVLVANLKKMEKRYPNTPHTLACVNVLGGIYVKTGDAESGRRLLLPGFDQMKRIFPPGHKVIEATAFNLGMAHLKLGEASEAVPLLKRYVAHRRTFMKSDPNGFSNMLIQLAKDLMSKNQAATAEEFLREALDVGKVKYKDHPATHNTTGILGESLMSQAKQLLPSDKQRAELKFAAAEKCLLESQAGFAAHINKLPKSYRLQAKRTAIERLIKLYKAWGKREQQTEWQQKLEALPTNG